MDFKIPCFDPICSSDEDLLGFKKAAKRLANTFDSIETPNCFGVYGVWGSGKTSLLNLIEEQLISDKKYSKRIGVVRFNPWEYEYIKDVPLVFHLLNKIIQTTKSNEGLIKIAKNYIESSLSMGAFLTGIAAKSCAGVGMKESREESKISEQLFNSEFDYWRKYQCDFKKEFNEKLQRALKNNKIEKLYIFIDDMDRCLQGNAIKILEAMKNFLNVDNTLFIIGMDRRVIINHINNKYGKDYGVEYLSKIIPLSISLPEREGLALVQSSLKKLRKNILSDSEIQEISLHLRTYCGSNRRLAHIVLHKFLVILSYIAIDKLLNELKKIGLNRFQNSTRCHLALFRWCLIQEIQPEFFEQYDWPSKFQEILNKGEDNIINDIAIGWRIEPKGRDSRPLLVPIGVGSAKILNRYINESPFE